MTAEDFAQLFLVIVCCVCVGLWLSPPWYAYFPLWIVFTKCLEQ